jgi:hypothetical protein
VPDKSWKRAERQIATALGTRRDTFAFARGDVIHDRLAIDVKRRLRYTLNEARADLAKLAAANAGKTPIVAAVDIPGRGYKSAATLVVIRLEDFVALVKPVEVIS